MLANKLLGGIALLAISLIALDSLFESVSFRSIINGDYQADLETLLRNNGEQDQRKPSNASAHNGTASKRYTIMLPLDHDNLHFGNFSNRYWVNAKHYRPGGPVFIHDVGETDAASSATKYLSGENSYLEQLLQEFHGIGLVWEHRNYGQSLLLGDQSTTMEALRFLTIDQSLADVPYLARNFMLPQLPGQDLTPSSTPWVMLGCSYSGLRTAFSRQRYPDTIFAAYSASAPVQLTANLDNFFDAVHLKMVNTGYANCAQDLHVVMHFIDEQLSNERNASLIKQKFLGSGAEANSNGDFALALANIYSHFQSGGIEAGTHSLASLCDYLELSPYTGRVAGPAGLASEYGIEYLVDRLSSWPPLVSIINNNFNVSCNRTMKVINTQCSLDQHATAVGDVSWTWQLCSELGLFVTQTPGPLSLVSRYLSLQYRQATCERQFPQAKENGLLMNLSPVDRINEISGGSMMRPSNVFWTAGEYDPWRILSPLAPNLTTDTGIAIATSSEIPKSNISTASDTVLGYVLRNAEHCFDFNMDDTEARTAQAHFRRALRQWLPLYRRR